MEEKHNHETRPVIDIKEFSSDQLSTLAAIEDILDPFIADDAIDILRAVEMRMPL